MVLLAIDFHKWIRIEIEAWLKDEAGSIFKIFSSVSEEEYDRYPHLNAFRSGTEDLREILSLVL
jgi:hypothetical protein